jgi:hypothetical protein
MFQSKTAAYALLTQYHSQRCSEFLKIEKSILVPSILSTNSEIKRFQASDLQGLSPSFCASVMESSGKGRSDQVLRFLREQNPQLEFDKIRLRIQLDKDHFHDFKISWGHTGKELMVFSNQGMQKKPADAIKQVLGHALPPKTGNIARRYGVFIDVSGNQIRKIISYADIERHLWLASQDRLSTPNQIRLGEIQKVCTYFDTIDTHKQTKIKGNILNRKTLWREFVTKKHMTSAEFKQLSKFKPRAIGGFIHFLTYNGIASRFADVFMLNNAAAHHIKRLLNM